MTSRHHAMVVPSKTIFVVFFLKSLISHTCIHGEIILYERLDTDVTFNCPFRETAKDTNTLVWYGPPYTAGLGILYISTIDGVSATTVLGDRLSVVGNHTAGEYNMKISNLQQSDEGRFICESGNNRIYFYLQIKVPLTAIIINLQSITVIEGRSREVKCTTSDSVPAANVTWYIFRQGSPTVQITSGIANTQENKTTISTLTYTGQKQDNDGILYCNASQQTTQIKSQSVPISVLYKPSNIRIFPEFEPYIIYVTQTGVQLHCTADVGNPHSITYTWSHNGVDTSNNPYVVTVTKNSGGNYTCTANNSAGVITTHKTIAVQYGPTIDPVNPQKFIAGRYATVKCKVNSYPDADITWTGPNNFHQTGQLLIFNKTIQSHKGIYNCTATNMLTPSGQSNINKQQQINVDVDILYKPEIIDIPSPSIVEGQKLILTCLTRANPTAHSYNWTKIGNKTFQQLNETLVIANIRRTQGGKYKCTAMNTMTSTDGQTETGEGHGEVSVNVKYPPAISSLDLVGSVREKTEGETAIFKCVVDSYPKSNVSWTSNTGKSRTDFIDLQKNISLYNIKVNCLDTGKYICTASNGIGNTVTNETDLFVRCSPRIDTRYNQNNVTEIRIKDGQGLNISARYLAYPIANVTWVFSHQNSSDNTTTPLHHDEDDINIVNKSYIYWQISKLIKPIMTEDDFGTYTVTFQNDLSSASSVFYVNAARAPAQPLFVSSECLKDLTVNVSWMPGFNGGSEQTFEIQYRQSSENNFTIWTNKLQDQRINITENVKGLTNGVEYAFRVVAVNSYGKTPSDEYSCTTAKPTSTESLIVLPIVGGTLGTLTGFAAVIIFLLFLRRRKHTKAKKRNDEFSMNGKSRLTERDSCEEEDGMKVNILYEPAVPNFKPEGATGGKKDIYSEVKKPNRVGNTSGDIYAQVQKKAKQSKEESNKPPDLDAVVQKPKTKEPAEKNKKRFGKGKQEKPKKDSESKKDTVANEGNIYENVEKLNAENGAFEVGGTDESLPGPSGTKSEGNPPKPEKPPKRNKNKLIYADLVLEEGTKDGNRFVIRGEEDRTQYVEIDFSKRAKPLPPDNKEIEVKSPAEVTTSEEGKPKIES